MTERAPRPWPRSRDACARKGLPGLGRPPWRSRLALAVASLACAVLLASPVARAIEAGERFGVPRGDLGPAEARRFERGRALFDSHAGEKGASGVALSGLGPVYNVEGCGGCHIGDGRGRPPLVQGEPLRQMVIRLSIRAADGRIVPHPAYGAQLNDQAIPGVPAEGEAFVEYSALEGRYGEGAAYELARPHYGFLGMAYGRLDDAVMISARVPPQLAGSGLLEAVPERAVLERADEEDSDGDGISGRPNRVLDVMSGRLRLGRFGWKANQPSLRQQIANAARTDMGVTSALYRDEDCPSVQRVCVAAGSQGRPELGEDALRALEAYLEGLDPPKRIGAANPEAARGETLFDAFGCARCHVPALPVNLGDPARTAPRTIAAYTDLLLHDMGEGLADGRPDGLASGAEWRTAPLWGIGRTKAINGHTRFLHDGRARDLAEAILWHGGEAEAAKERFRKASPAERRALLAFLGSL